MIFIKNILSFIDTEFYRYIIVGGLAFIVDIFSLYIFTEYYHKNGALATYKFLYPYTYNVYNLINQYKPKIISNYYIDDMNHNAISKHYQVSNQYSDIYIRND